LWMSRTIWGSPKKRSCGWFKNLPIWTWFECCFLDFWTCPANYEV
jgi:hypothetical protein